MSVRGEFVRIVGDAIALLRSEGSEPAEALAVDLERARDDASDDLCGAAARVIELWEAGASRVVGGGAQGRVGLEDAGERVLAVSRIILGR